MKREQCPICGDKLIVREVTPCIECGALDDQVSLLKQDIRESFIHDSVEFEEYRIFEKLELALCSFCALDMSSYDPQYFGLPKNQVIGLEKLQFLKKLNKPSIGKDKFCRECNQRLAFIKFLLSARNLDAL